MFTVTLLIVLVLTCNNNVNCFDFEENSQGFDMGDKIQRIQADGCEWSGGAELSSVTVFSGVMCAGKCKSLLGCSHYAFQSGTCSLRIDDYKNEISAVESSDPSASCGQIKGSSEEQQSQGIYSKF
jgi:hypothetical protein